MISAVPLAEFYDHESMIASVHLERNGTFAAAGAEDGTLIVWDVNTQSMVFSCQVSLQRKYVV